MTNPIDDQPASVPPFRDPSGRVRPDRGRPLRTVVSREKPVRETAAVQAATLASNVNSAVMLDAVQREIVGLEKLGLRLPAIYGAVMYLLQRAIDEDNAR